ncbi:tRNA 2-thiouridine(34) synthase MnmA [Leptogranulimonas caecicola]|uniref:tRNA-uridine 2-sulfurtransferase n=1 Tax=Leptogranulimonas caecicola TaxID=2894156 RepID=A0AAU9CBC3_9ACTN|nr:tRNA 2-thiouridine(34) synthase MnmA [Leptogranulimonas caecicola]BCV18508.1 tRNA-specific 2-thiouridylase MnmA [Atopobiaceae bacterium P1]BDC90839.1 tRNA-specific 2-thiouridylase MnmA [Leptogranulimonas caecicola]
MKVVVGLSGGVDSSCAVARLKEAGHEVVAATLLMQQGDVSVPSKESLAQAQELCGTLGVPFIARPMDEAFSRQVLDPFVDAYLSGKTPSPCVACNRYVKVAGLMAIADEVGADKVATGHYISLIEGEDGQVRLARGADRAKDQSYFLCQLPPEWVPRLMAPLAASTKDQVRAYAKEASLKVAEAPDSQGVCFAPQGDYRAFLVSRRPDAFEPGDIVNEEGQVVGHHSGVAGFTVGQRKGLAITDGAGPYFVTSVDASARRVQVARQKPPRTTSFLVGDLVTTMDLSSLDPSQLSVQTHYRAYAVPACVRALGDGLWQVQVEEPGILGVPGQTAAFYQGDVVVGGATIEDERPIDD